ncbi:MAG TPA: helix-turn-helix domain-containing protein, partial [Dehalococcoidia bacterium]|nr:helix-turn-helix domain-containing protein [Dehalococcoidia bacterium]
MRAYSEDLRERAVAAVERGLARPEVVAAFGVSRASLKRWLATSRAGGDRRTQPPPGARPTIGPEQGAAWPAQLAAHPNATGAEQAELWNREQGTTLSHGPSGGRSGATAGRGTKDPPGSGARRGATASVPGAPR